MIFKSIHLHAKWNSKEVSVSSVRFELAGLGEVEMKQFNLTDVCVNMLKKELECQIMHRLGRDFKEQFNEEKTIHKVGSAATSLLAVQKASSSSVADLLGSEPIPPDLS